MSLPFQIIFVELSTWVVALPLREYSTCHLLFYRTYRQNSYVIQFNQQLLRINLCLCARNFNSYSRVIKCKPLRCSYLPQINKNFLDCELDLISNYLYISDTDLKFYLCPDLLQYV